MAKVIGQSGTIIFKTAKYSYIVELIEDDYVALGWNVRSNSGINHYENGLLHKTFEQAYKAMKEAIKYEDK